MNLHGAALTKLLKGTLENNPAGIYLFKINNWKHQNYVCYWHRSDDFIVNFE